MDTRRREPRSGTDFARQAETLIRSLAGVVHAHVLPTQGEDPEIDAIHVVAADERTARHMTGHVRSALLAGLATPIVPSRIHVRTAPGDAWTDDRARDSASGPPRTDRLRLLHATDSPGSHALGNGDAPRNGNGPADGHAVSYGRGASDVHDTSSLPLDSPGTPAWDRSRLHNHDRHAAPGDAAARHGRARLIAVDVQKAGDGRVRCHVSVAWNAHVHRSDAVAMDLPGAAPQAAAQATVRALTSAGVHGLELNGLREVEIAGRDYVLVALRRTDSGSVRLRSGSALMVGTPERTAAEATIAAANELL